MRPQGTYGRATLRERRWPYLLIWKSASAARGKVRRRFALVAAPLDAVFEYSPGLGVHTDFMHDRAVLDIEGIAQAAAAFFLLQLLRCDLPGKDLERYGAGLGQGDFRLRGELFARERPSRGKSRRHRADR